MKKLIVCGDSYMTPMNRPWKGKEVVGTHFSEIIARRIGYELVVYARGGMSNLGICIQLHTALNYEPRPDLILLGTTSPDRSEWIYNDLQRIDKVSIKDINYHHPNSRSHKTPLAGDNPKVTSFQISDYFIKGGCLEQDGDIYKQERKQSMESWLTWLYHPDIKKFNDLQIRKAMFADLDQSGIPYVICYDWFKLHDSEIKKPKNLNYAMDDLIQIPAFGHIDNDDDPGYHTPLEVQQKIADVILEKYLLGIAQPGSALALGARGRLFEPDYRDQS